MSEAPVYVNLEFTPNPNTLKFSVNRSLLPSGSFNFTAAAEADHAPLARRVFAIPGVSAVMVGTSFVTVTKGTSGNWDVIAEEVPRAIETHLGGGLPAFDPEWLAQKRASSSNASAPEVEKKIREVLDSEIRPAVAMDGGDITFHKYEDGIVYLHLQGACSSCPSSVMTLKMGVENRLRDAVPEIREVVQV